MREHEALVAEARGQAKCYSEGGLRALIRSLADALETATVERAVVEAQALEQAADSIVRTSDGDDPKKYIVTSGDSGVRLISQHDYKQIRGFDKALSIVDWLRARAVEIREGRQ